MPEKRGVCPNSASCKLAQEGRVLTGEIHCPECGSKLRAAPPETNAMWLRIGVAVIWVAVLAAAVALGWKLSGGSTAPSNPSELATPAANVVTTANSPVSDAERQEVLKRIDAMPNVSAANKERLYVYVERARKISRVLNVNFERNKSRLGESAIKKIVEETRMPEFANQARDPAVVFIVLGFADKRGDEKSNLQVSLDRADHVMDVLRKRCGLLNIVQTVPMGGAELSNPQDPAGNRVAEVWAVLP